ncbi:thioesterase domain-containing protein [Paenibacillus pasadenensis]|uniref:thioesterase domain-containing protein n=1 Tax=Paenibacillus pasadenensis TaxID=217090 RepID=UPI00203C0ABD|nr:thioesterase domain-containing protein [Paenibacillus pasadenensis]MCM3748367.1 thioesterase domain-containing protein [Paenibacillus pasadenensis]
MERKGMPERLTVYHVAGVATYPSTFYECRKQLARIFAEHGTEAEFETLFPYGDYSRSLWRQVWEVRSDLTRMVLPTRIGGKSMLREIQRTHGGGPILLIGHSGGGVAAYQAARLLRRQGMPAEELRVAQIGSPKVPVEDEMRDYVAYFYAVNALGKADDPITRIGSWGGWRAGTRRVPVWSRTRHSPSHVRGIPVMGGHTNYFRHQLPFVDNQSRSNLDKTVEAMAEWLQASYFSITL